MTKFLLPTAALWVLLVLGASADEQVRRVQEELRRRNLYFGEVDGRKTDETTSAIRRYQSRKNLAASGELTQGTLRSLDVSITGPVAEEWPEVAVLKSDAARELVESDRKMLEEMSAGDPPPVAEGPAFSGVEAAGEPPADNPPKQEETSAPVPAPPKAEQPAPAPAAETDETGELEKRVRTFVASYLAACETNEQEEELKFYADRMDYFDQGVVNRDFVARDVQRFYKRWPTRQYKLLDLRLAKAPQGTLEAIFRISFQYSRGPQKVAGRTLNRFRLQPDEEGFHFVALREQRIRN